MKILHRCVSTPIVPAREVPGAVGGPLCGVRFVGQANIDCAGYRTGNGSPGWLVSHEPSKRSAPCLGALLRVGALLVGMAHQDELGFSLAGRNEHYGRLDNPAAPGRSVGGAASGPAVAVASREAELALGLDTCGSVRVPASHCGLFGLRTTHGRVSTEGVCALAPSLDAIGLLAASATTALAAARALLAPIEPDARPREPPPPPSSVTVLFAEDALRLFSCAEQTDLPAKGRSAAEAAYGARARRIAQTVAWRAQGVVPIDVGAHLLEAVGEDLASLAPDGAACPGLQAAGRLLRAIHAEEATASFEKWREEYEEVAGAPPLLGAETAALVACAAGEARLGADGRRTRAALGEALGWLLASHEDGEGALALLCLPAAPSAAPLPAVPHEAAYRERCLALAALASLAGCPQLVVPAGTCPVSGLPLSVSFLARPGRDDELVQAVTRVMGDDDGDE